MPTAIMGDTAVAMGSEKYHLVFKSVGAERPAVAEDHRLSRAPIFVINLCAVFCGKGAHKILLRLAGGG
jgi:hypothetical protein